MCERNIGQLFSIRTPTELSPQPRLCALTRNQTSLSVHGLMFETADHSGWAQVMLILTVKSVGEVSFPE